MTRAAPKGNGAAFCGGANTVFVGRLTQSTQSGNGRFLAYTKSTHRVATAAFWRTHRVHTEWQLPLSRVHSIMRVKLAQAGEGGGFTPVMGKSRPSIKTP
jgi:hypothetical protein